VSTVAAHPLRLPGASLVGLVVTFCLLVLMQQLIATDDSGWQEAAPPPTFTIWREIEVVEPETTPPQPPIEVERPPAELPPVSTDGRGGTVDITIGPPTIVRPTSQSAALSDGESALLVSVSPRYPPRALARGLEGWVLLELDIGAQGSVEAVRIVEAEPPGVFDRAATEAASRFKFRPRVVAGEAMPVRGVLHRIVFELLK